MLAWIRFAFRNLLRNKRRSLHTIIAVAIGFAAINLFGGFTTYIFTNLRESFIYIEANGHLAIFKSAEAASRRMLPGDDQLLTADEVRKIRQLAAEDPNITGVAEAMNLTGLISNGNVSTIFIAAAWLPSEKLAFQNQARGLVARLKFYEGEPLRDDLQYGIGIARGLAQILSGGTGSSAILIAPTVEGQINAMDAKVVQLTDTPMELLEDKLVIMPLGLARTLYNTDGASRVSITLASGVDWLAAKSQLEERLRAIGLGVHVIAWRDLSPFYIKVEQMFNIIFFFMFLIVCVIVIMSVVNTVNMSVLERSREIGTLRAMGARRSQIISLFSLEGALLGLFGCLLGSLVFAAALAAFRYMAPEWTPPQIARAIPLELHVVPEYLATSAFFLTVLSLVSGVFPARRIARLNIVKALSHV